MLTTFLKYALVILLIAAILQSCGNSGDATKPEAACTNTSGGGCYGIEYCYDTGDGWATCYHEYNGRLYDRDGNPMP